MTTPLLFSFPDTQKMAAALCNTGKYQSGDMVLHTFPDGETLVRLDSDVTGRDVTFLCTLDRPDDKAMALMFAAQTARELGAKSVSLVAPYLGYMRQDKRFHDGEAVTSGIFAAFLSRHFDALTTIDPHLHRHKTMDDIYTIPTRVLHAADTLAAWIQTNVEKPVLVGPDGESDQWVADVAQKINAPYTVLSKQRSGDTDVRVSVPHLDGCRDCTPVLVDVIISTARTMIATIGHLRDAHARPPVCIGIHAVFAGDAYQALQQSGPARIATCNTIPHPTNAIDITPLLANAARP